MTAIVSTRQKKSGNKSRPIVELVFIILGNTPDVHSAHHAPALDGSHHMPN